jgi:hypothetical protein
MQTYMEHVDTKIVLTQAGILEDRNIKPPMNYSYLYLIPAG